MKTDLRKHALEDFSSLTRNSAGSAFLKAGKAVFGGSCGDCKPTTNRWVEDYSSALAGA